MLPDQELEELWRATKQRQRQAFRPGTVANHKSQFQLYVSFCLHFGLQDIKPTVPTICMYCEFLARSFSSPKTIRNYISGVRLMHKYVHASADSIHSFELELMLRALDVNLRHVPNQRLPISESLLSKLCTLCDTLDSFGSTMKCAILLSYFGFLRQCNLAPKSARFFDPSRHTCRGDVIVHPPGLILVLKWSKTLQKSSQYVNIPIPGIPGHPLCPVRAYQQMTRAVPASANHPLLLVSDAGGVTSPLTLRGLARAFQVLITSLGYQRAAYSLHSLRRGGATASYLAGVDFINIKRHGTWRSDAFWEYISSNSVENSKVAGALAHRTRTLIKS